MLLQPADAVLVSVADNTTYASHSQFARAAFSNFCDVCCIFTAPHVHYANVTGVRGKSADVSANEFIHNERKSTKSGLRNTSVHVSQFTRTLQTM